MVEPLHGLMCPVLCFPRLARIVIEINHVLNGLVAMRVVAHSCNLHFPHLMDYAAIVCGIEDRRHVENFIKLGNESLLPPIRFISPCISWNTDHV